MTRAAAQLQAAWGLELTQQSVELVRAARTETGGVRVDRTQQFGVGEFWNSGVFDQTVIDALAQIPAGEPLGICFPNSAMMCRGFTLPQTAGDATEKMVTAQAEAMFFVGDDRLAWTWRKFADPQNPAMDLIVLCAARRKLLDDLKRTVPAAVSLDALLPRAMAIAATRSAAGASELLIELTEESATFALLIEGRLWRSFVLGRELPPAALMREARQGYQTMMQGFDRQRWPTQGVVRAASVDEAKLLAESLAAGIGINLTTEESTAGALAAAMLVLDGDASAPSINFAASKKRTANNLSLHWRPIAIAAAACLVGVLLLYGIDCLRDSLLTRQFEQLRSAEAASGGIERRLAVGRYLEKNVSPALPGFDTVLSAAPPSLNMTSFGLSAAGQFHLSGMLNSASELDDFLRKLQASNTLTNVQLRSARVDQNRWQVDLTADATPMAGLLLGSAKPAAAQPPARPIARPATQPAMRGGA